MSPDLVLWCDGAHDAAENMRRDAALLARAETGAAPVLRLFRFAPPGITLGRNQSPDRELDPARCAADGVPWAIRPTGGRAIFHAEEWTYSLAAPHGNPAWGGSARVTYERASALVMHALVRMGVPATLARRRSPGPGAAPAPRAPGSAAAPCFASTARSEVVVQDLKLVGSAQRRTARAWLQQGSILLGEGHLRLADYLAIPEAERIGVRETLRRAATSAAPWLGTHAPLERFAEALAAGLPPRTTRVRGAAGLFLLTASGSDSYTAPVV